MITLKKWPLRTFLLQIILGLIILCAPGAQATDYEGNVERIYAVDGYPPHAAEWKRTPTVVVCQYAPVSEAQIKKAVKFWKALGHRFFRTQYKYDPANKCNSPNPLGYIVIHLVTQGIRLDDNNLAETHFFINNETEIRHEMRDIKNKTELLIKKLSAQQDIENLVVTRGREGAMIYNKTHNKFDSCGAFADTALDKIGSGDAMLSIISLCLKNGFMRELALLIGSLAASQSTETFGNKESVDKTKILKALEHLIK